MAEEESFVQFASILDRMGNWRKTEDAELSLKKNKGPWGMSEEKLQVLVGRKFPKSYQVFLDKGHIPGAESCQGLRVQSSGVWTLEGQGSWSMRSAKGLNTWGCQLCWLPAQLLSLMSANRNGALLAHTDGGKNPQPGGWHFYTKHTQHVITRITCLETSYRHGSDILLLQTATECGIMQIWKLMKNLH